MIKQSYWIATVNGYYARVDGEQRDRFTPLGWREADEPGPTDFVYLRKDGLAQPAPFAYGAVPVWQDMGWEFSPPPEPVDLTKDPAPPEPPKPPVAEKAVKSKPAAAADKNSEE